MSWTRTSDELQLCPLVTHTLSVRKVRLLSATLLRDALCLPTSWRSFMSPQKEKTVTEELHPCNGNTDYVDSHFLE